MCACVRVCFLKKWAFSFFAKTVQQCVLSHTLGFLVFFQKTNSDEGDEGSEFVDIVNCHLGVAVALCVY
jgi:hypothetical protein